MKKIILISVVIPIKGRFDFVCQSILSVFNQSSYQDSIEIIIVEDNTVVHSLRQPLKEKFPFIRIYKNRDTEGPGGCRNTGLLFAKGRYVVFLDSDDVLDKHFLTYMLPVLKNNSAIASVCMSLSYFSPGYSLKEKIKLYPLIFIRDTILLLSYYINNTNLFPGAFYICQISHMLFQTSRIKDLVFNYEYRRGGEDWDFFSRVLQKGNITIIPRRLVLFRYSKGSTTDMNLNRVKKWKSYLLLAHRLPLNNKRGFFYFLLLLYIRFFGGKNAKG